MSVFGLASKQLKSWFSLSDLNPATVAMLEQNVTQAGPNYRSFKLSPQAMEAVLMRNQELLTVANEDMLLVNSGIGIPHLFIVTDPYGFAIRIIGEQEIVERLRSSEIDIGSSFAYENAGINGVSLAMHLQGTVVVQDNEHTLAFYKNWACVCSPVRLSDEICGYVDLSFHTDVDVTFAVPLLNKMIEKMESNLRDNRARIRKESENGLFDAYHLSNREQEVALGWLQNKSVLQMAHTMGITEGTIRNVLKKVYAKTGVNDKGQFFRKFLK